MTSYYPIAVDLSKRKVLVVGGGKVALRKIETLLEYGADVTVVSPVVEDGIRTLALQEKIDLRVKPYQSSDMHGVSLVIAATDDKEVNTRVSRDGVAANALVNVVDVPDLCDFIVPATVRRGDLIIGIWTAGKSPALAKKIRKRLEEEFGSEYTQYVEILGEMREIVKGKYESQKEREAAFHKLLDSDVLDLVRRGQVEEAREKALSCI